jgi:small subunit ribosomal protein S8
MSMSDPIADLLSRSRNAQVAKLDRLDVPASKLKLEVVKLLKDEGFIKNFREIEGTPVGTLRVFLRYSQDGVPAISNIERVSKPGRRVYRKSDEIQPVRNGLGIGIVSTSQGLLTDAQARDRRVGGELLCQVW